MMPFLILLKVVLCHLVCIDGPGEVSWVQATGNHLGDLSMLSQNCEIER